MLESAGAVHCLCTWSPTLLRGRFHDHLRVVLRVWVVDPFLDVKGMASRCATLDIEHRINARVTMNDPEAIMSHALSRSDLMVYRRAVDAAGQAIRLVRRTPAPLKSLADQVIRSAASVPANLAEGHGRSGRDRIHHWRIAYGSAKEVDCHLRLLAHAGAIDPTGARSVLGLFDEVRAMTWRLLNPRP